MFLKYPFDFNSKFNTPVLDKMIFSASREEWDILLLTPLETFHIEKQLHDLKKNIRPGKIMQVFFLAIRGFYHGIPVITR